MVKSKAYIEQVGLKVGQLEEVKVDSKHRVVLPEEVRQKSGIKAGSKLKVSVKAGSIVLTKNVQPSDFIERMEGLLKEGSPVHASDPLKLKEIWAKH